MKTSSNLNQASHKRDRKLGHISNKENNKMALWYDVSKFEKCQSLIIHIESVISQLHIKWSSSCRIQNSMSVQRTAACNTSPPALRTGDKCRWFQNGVLSFLYPYTEMKKQKRKYSQYK
jgi:hypothetical protein